MGEGRERAEDGGNQEKKGKGGGIDRHSLRGKILGSKSQFQGQEQRPQSSTAKPGGGKIKGGSEILGRGKIDHQGNVKEWSLSCDDFLGKKKSGE